MPSYTSELSKKGIISPPRWLADNIHYECIMGSFAYGCNDQDSSDFDLYGWAIPPKEDVFPHLRGEIVGFGQPKNRFEQFATEKTVSDPSAVGGIGRKYDISIYNIVKYFQLVMNNNPNMLDSLFVPENCVTHITQVGQMVREKRKIFLSKKAWHTFKGYAFSQMHKIDTKGHVGMSDVVAFEKQHGIPKTTRLSDVVSELTQREMTSERLENGTMLQRLSDQDLRTYNSLYKLMVDNGKRSEGVKIHGFDLKFAYHVIRLLDECDQVLTTGDINLQRDKERMKAIRRGDFTEEEIKDLFEQKQKYLEGVYNDSSLPWSPNENAIKELLLNCLEHNFGSLDKCVVREDEAVRALRDVAVVVDKYRHILS